MALDPIVGSEVAVPESLTTHDVQHGEFHPTAEIEVVRQMDFKCELVRRGAAPVSYTHLTLPTILRV